MEAVASLVTNTGEVPTVLSQMRTQKGTPRFRAFLILMRLSQDHPELLYTHWDSLASMLSPHTATDHKYEAICLLPNLLNVDKNKKFEKLLPQYFALLNDDALIPPAQVALLAGKIVAAKPTLEPIITAALCGIDDTHHEPRRKALIAANAIESFIEYYPIATDPAKIMAFVKAHMQDPSPKARKNAKIFLLKYAYSVKNHGEKSRK